MLRTVERGCAEMDVAESRARPNQFARQLFAGLPKRYNVLAELLSMRDGGGDRWRHLDARRVTDPVAAA